MTISVADDFGLLCWEGYHAASVLNPFCDAHALVPRAQPLLSDAGTAADLAQGASQPWDVLNINNAYVRDYLHPRGLIAPLPRSRFAPYIEQWLPEFSSLYPWAYSNDQQLLGICQRFGAFNLVVNTQRIDTRNAQDQGFNLANDAAMADRFGILKYDDFNIFHICLGARINPFEPLNAAQLRAFSTTAHDWHQRARLVTDDHHALNAALVSGEIDFYISGGGYTVSPARMQGHLQLQAITPAKGSIDGKGGIVFAEITSCLNASRKPAIGMDFLEYLMQPETAVQIATYQGSLNPVVQMGDPGVFARFDKRFLDAIQWQTLEEDISRCAHYQLVPSHAQLLSILRVARFAR